MMPVVRAEARPQVPLAGPAQGKIQSPGKSPFRKVFAPNGRYMGTAVEFGNYRIPGETARPGLALPKAPPPRQIGAVPVLLGANGPGKPELAPPSGVPKGKASLTRVEASGFLAVLEEITKPIDEALAEAEDIECVRELAAGPYPLVLKVRNRLREELATDAKEFPVSQGELTVAEKAVECAEAIGTVKTTRKVVTVGAAGAVAAVIFFLL